MLSISLTSHRINSNPRRMTGYIFGNGQLHSSKSNVSIIFLWEVCFILEKFNMRILVIFKIPSLKEKGFAIPKNK